MREHFYTDGLTGMTADIHHVYVCAHKHEKPAIPFANIDMGVPIQSCFKDYCLLRSHFIRLKDTPQGAHSGCCRSPSLLASLLC